MARTIVLVLAVLAGWGLGSWLGSIGQGSPPPSATPSPAATQEPSQSAPPSISPVTSASAVAPFGTILEISGIKDKVSDTFTVLPGWQVVWQTEGGGFAFAVRGDRDLGTIVSQEQAASGATSLPTPGTFHIEVTAKGPWTLKVLQGEAPPTPTPSATPS
jgi:hypothetical protein